MTGEELIGKTIVNIANEKGTVSGIDEDGRIIVSYEDRTAHYVKDAFVRGFLELEDPKDQQKIKLERIQRNQAALDEEIGQYLSELNSLVGLDNIKERVQDLVCEINVSKLRDAYGLKCVETSKHMVFVGNPGTGKTTVARIIAKIYKSLGVLSRGQLIEADRSSLVAGYQGQTALKTKEMVSRAIGGVLFIDEAYSLCREKDDDFGYEALDTLVKEIEDHRNNLMVIVAGYKDEMNTFLNANPGLSSRFKTVISFEDYTSEELYRILKDLLKNNDYVLTKEADKTMRKYFQEMKTVSGNGRTVRNYFEEIVRYQSRRINSIKDINKDLLVTIEEEDLMGLIEPCC